MNVALLLLAAERVADGATVALPVHKLHPDDLASYSPTLNPVHDPFLRSDKARRTAIALLCAADEADSPHIPAPTETIEDTK